MNITNEMKNKVLLKLMKSYAQNIYDSINLYETEDSAEKKIEYIEHACDSIQLLWGRSWELSNLIKPAVSYIRKEDE